MSIAASFEIEYLQYLGPDGTLVRNDLPEAGRDIARLRELFKQMLLVRTFDTKAIALQRTGKLGTYASCLGHEAAHIGIGSAMQYDDVFAPSYREYGAMFMRGVRPRDVLMYWGGDERGNDYGGNAAKDFPFCVPMSTQCLPAAGAALKLRVSNTILSYGEQRVKTPVFSSSDSRLCVRCSARLLSASWSSTASRFSRRDSNQLSSQAPRCSAHWPQENRNTLGRQITSNASMPNAEPVKPSQRTTTGPSA